MDKTIFQHFEERRGLIWFSFTWFGLIQPLAFTLVTFSLQSSTIEELSGSSKEKPGQVTGTVSEVSKARQDEPGIISIGSTEKIARSPSSKSMFFHFVLFLIPGFELKRFTT